MLRKNTQHNLTGNIMTPWISLNRCSFMLSYHNAELTCRPPKFLRDSVTGFLRSGLTSCSLIFINLHGVIEVKLALRISMLLKNVQLAIDHSFFADLTINQGKYRKLVINGVPYLESQPPFHL